MIVFCARAPSCLKVYSPSRQPNGPPSSLTVTPVLHDTLPSIFPFKPCPTIYQSLGRITQTLHQSHYCSITQRSSILLESSLHQRSMVRRPIPRFALILSVRSATQGIVVILFSRCVDALINPINRPKGGIRWGLMVHTFTMFSFVTVYTGTTLHILSTCYINDREFLGDTESPPGPLGYQVLLYTQAIGIVPSVFFLVNQWMADGLLVSSPHGITAS